MTNLQESGSRSRQPSSVHSPTRVDTSDRIPPWTYGTRALMRDLARRGLLGGTP